MTLARDIARLKNLLGSGSEGRVLTCLSHVASALHAIADQLQPSPASDLLSRSGNPSSLGFDFGPTAAQILSEGHQVDMRPRIVNGVVRPYIINRLAIPAGTSHATFNCASNNVRVQSGSPSDTILRLTGDTYGLHINGGYWGANSSNVLVAGNEMTLGNAVFRDMWTTGNAFVIETLVNSTWDTCRFDDGEAVVVTPAGAEGGYANANQWLKCNWKNCSKAVWLVNADSHQKVRNSIIGGTMENEDAKVSSVPLIKAQGLIRGLQVHYVYFERCTTDVEIDVSGWDNSAGVEHPATSVDIGWCAFNLNREGQEARIRVNGRASANIHDNEFFLQDQKINGSYVQNQVCLIADGSGKTGTEPYDYLTWFHRNRIQWGGAAQNKPATYNAAAYKTTAQNPATVDVIPHPACSGFDPFP